MAESKAGRLSTAMQHAFGSAATAWRDGGRWVRWRQQQVFVVERGSGPVLLMLHGFPTSSFDWRGMIDLLASDFRCLALDFPGYGLSDKPSACSYSLFDQADAVEEVAQTLRVSEAHVVSHDMGTSVHCELLARQAGDSGCAFRVQSSTFLNGSMLQWLATMTPFQELLAANASLPQAMEMCTQAVEMYVPGLLAIMQRPDAIGTDDRQAMRELLAYQQGHLRLPALAGYMRERYVHRERWLGALTACRPPMQLVWADGDPIANRAMGQELARMCPAARYTELVGLGHFLLMEDPAAVARAVRLFVAEQV